MSTGEVFLSVSAVPPDTATKRMLTPLMEEDDDDIIDTSTQGSRLALTHPEFDLSKLQKERTNCMLKSILQN